MRRETGIMLLSGKPFFLGRRDNLSLTDEARRAIMIECRNPKDMIHTQVRLVFAKPAPSCQAYVMRSD
jgi:hypothetical protein